MADQLLRAKVRGRGDVRAPSSVGTGRGVDLPQMPPQNPGTWAWAIRAGSTKTMDGGLVGLDDQARFFLVSGSLTIMVSVYKSSP